MSTTANTQSGVAIDGDLINTGTFIGHDQIIVLSGYSGEQLETVLARLQTMLSGGRADLSADLQRGRLTVTAPDSTDGAPLRITLSSEAAKALSLTAARQNDERAYLSALLVNPRYGRWAAQFVPLAGTLTTLERPPGWLDVPPEFVSLEVSGEGAGRQVRRVRLGDIIQAVQEHPALALLGEPGAGKTTVLYKLALDAARHRLAGGDGRLPLLMSLADFRGDFRSAASPFAFVEAAWKQGLGRSDGLSDLLRGGKLLLLFDALNEMPSADARDYRERVGAWRRFVEEWPGNQIIFTCRSRDYSEPLGLHQVEIDRMDDGRVQDFLDKYLPGALSQDAWAHLQDRPLLELVRNPYYLWMLTYILCCGSGWPENRAALFRGFVQTLLGREEQRGHADWPGETALAQALAALAYEMQGLGEGTRLPCARALEMLPAQVASLDGAAVTPDTVLRLGLAATLLDTELSSGGDEQVRFYHHQLQEYFAAQEMVVRFKAGEAPDDRWQQPQTVQEMPDPGPLGDNEPLPPPPTTGWEEVTTLAAALAPDAAAFVDTVRRANPVLAARCLTEGGIDLPEMKRSIQASLWHNMDDRRVHLRARIAAGEALGRLGAPRFKTIEVEGHKVILPPLVHVPAGRFKIGSSIWQVLALALRGFSANDELPRHEVELPEFYLGQYPVTNAEYACFVQAGGYAEEQYWQTERSRAWLRGELSDEGPLEQGMGAWRAIKANPALLQQFKRAGYSPQQIDALTQLSQMEEQEVRAVFAKAYGERRRDQPAFWDDARYNNPAQPVVGVTWFEALAYCTWLEKQLRAAGTGAGLPVYGPDDEQVGSLDAARAAVSLPSEAEWERAARGNPHPSPSPARGGGSGWGRIYPWGRRFDAGRANTWEGHVLRPTPVGVYPGGVTPTGLHDMAGNVWEWTRSLYKPYPYDPTDGREDLAAEGARVVRGGSWNDTDRNARCAYRFRYIVDFWYHDLGFRVSVSLAGSDS